MKRLLVLSLIAIAACTSRMTSVDVVPNGSGAVVRGVVTDNTGAPLPGVTVTLDRHAAETDQNGMYEFRSVSPGTHPLLISLEGFNTVTMRVNVSDGKALTLQTRLKMAGVSEAITVTASAPAGEAFTFVAAPPPPPVTPMGTASTAINYAAPEALHPSPNYAPITEKGFIDARKETTTTFSIDVDGASYANVRRFLTANLMPNRDAVRIEEMVNYFTYSYPPPAAGSALGVTTEIAGCPWEPSHRLLRIGIQGKTIDAWKLAPNNLVFLLDVSGSMEPPQRLPLIKSAMRLLVDQLRPEDTVGIVVYAGAAGVALEPTSDKSAIIAALDRLSAGGATAGGAGIEAAYKLAEEHFSPSANNRVILGTDGDFNVGVTRLEELTNLIESKRHKGIYLTCLGVGNDNFDDALLESLADKGNGNYYYLDTIDEAKKVFINQLQGTLVAVAKDVKLQLEFNPAIVSSYRQIGYEDRTLANKDFEDDTKDAGELGSGHSVTALYEIAASGTGKVADLRVRYKEPSSEVSQLITSQVNDDGKSIYAASSDLQFAAAVAEFGMLLRGSNDRGSATYADVAALARAMRGPDLEGYRDEFLRMVDTSRTLSGEKPQAIAGK